MSFQLHLDASKSLSHTHLAAITPWLEPAIVWTCSVQLLASDRTCVPVTWSKMEAVNTAVGGAVLLAVTLFIVTLATSFLTVQRTGPDQSSRCANGCMRTGAMPATAQE